MEQPLLGDERLETPERVDLEIGVAGVGSRALAAILDYLILFAIAAGVILLVAVVASFSRFVTILLVITIFIIQWLYFALFEALSHGQTPGKRAMGLRVQSVGGYPLGWSGALIRNFMRIIDIQFAYGVGLIVMLITRRSQRIGDLVAGTIVVRERTAAVSVDEIGYVADADDAGVESELGLGTGEFERLHEFIVRSPGFDPASRERIRRGLAASVRATLIERGTMRRRWQDLGDEAFLLHVHAAQRGETIPLEDGDGSA